MFSWRAPPDTCSRRVATAYPCSGPREATVCRIMRSSVPCSTSALSLLDTPMKYASTSLGCQMESASETTLLLAGRRLDADRFAGDDQFHAAVLLPAGGGVVTGHRVGLAESDGRDAGGGHALLHEVIADGGGALFGQLL